MPDSKVRDKIGKMGIPRDANRIRGDKLVSEGQGRMQAPLVIPNIMVMGPRIGTRI